MFGHVGDFLYLCTRKPIDNKAMARLYYKTPAGRVYKYRGKHGDYYLQTPKENPEEDPRVTERDPAWVGINMNEARAYVNEVWRNHEETWEFEGKHYKAFPGDVAQLKDVPVHHFDDGASREGYRLVMHHGRLRWVWSDMQYWPRLNMYGFRGLDKSPHFIDFDRDMDINRLPMDSNWCHFNDVKFVYCIEDRCFI